MKGLISACDLKNQPCEDHNYYGICCLCSILIAKKNPFQLFDILGSPWTPFWELCENEEVLEQYLKSLKNSWETA
jgi:hypothetical protein